KENQCSTKRPADGKVWEAGQPPSISRPRPPRRNGTRHRSRDETSRDETGRKAGVNPRVGQLRFQEQRRRDTMSRILAAALLSTMLAGCGSTPATRTASGAVIGAGTGAIAGAAVAGTTGAVVGGLGGAAA